MIEQDEWNKLKAAEQYGMIAKIMMQLEDHERRLKDIETTLYKMDSE